MGQLSEHVYTESEGIAWLQDLIARLPGNARVTLDCKDGSQCTGTVVVRPTVEVFRGRDQAEGLNAVLRFQDDKAPAQVLHLWLDRIARVHKLDSISGQVEG